MILDIIKIIFVLSGVFTLVSLLTWIERKQSALMQDRIGANRADILGFRFIGLFHIIADGIKMLTKEDFIPPKANKFLHTLAPFIALFPVLVAFAVIPFGDKLVISGKEINLQIANLNVGILYVFGILSLGIYGVILGGWSSYNKYSLLGSIRAASQMISYEVTFGLTIIGLLMIYKTLDLSIIVKMQGDLLFGILPNWGVFLQPLGFILFFTAAIAETKRIPFDLPEGEPEIIGYFVEYSSMKFAMFFLSEFIEIIVAASVITTLFFGGWQVPFLTSTGFNFPYGISIVIPGNLISIIQMLSFGLKVCFFCWFMLLIRWTLPRFRYDQLMNFGWKMLLPLSILNVIITGSLIVLWKSSIL